MSPPSAAARDVLVVTPLDYATMPGNVEHARVRHLVERGYAVTVLTKRRNRRRGAFALLVDTCSFRLRDAERDGARTWELDPFFNPFAGLAGDADAAHARGRSPLRLLAPLGLLRELGFAACVVLTLLLRRRTRHRTLVAVGPWAALAGLAARASGRVARVVYLDRDFEPGVFGDHLRTWSTAYAERFAMRRADALVSTGERLRDRRRAEVGREPHLSPNGVDLAAYERAREAPREGRRLLYVGNVAPWSGVELAIRALARTVPRFADARLRVVGEASPRYRAKLEALVVELDLADHVELAGPLPPDALPGAYAAAEVALACSEPTELRRYARPLKLGEAFAAGLPVVVTRDTEAGDVVERTGAGIVVDHDVDALAVAFAELLGDPAGRRARGLRGVEVARGLDWTAVLDRELPLFALPAPRTAEAGA